MLDQDVFDGDFLSQSEKREGVLTTEGLLLVEKVKKAVTPEIRRVETYGFSQTTSERMVALNCSRRVDESKTYLKNYDLANIFTAVALSTILQSDNPDKVGQVLYERRDGGDDNYYDMLNASIDTKKKSINIPVPFIDNLFKRTLVEKRKFINYTPDFSHNRQFSYSEAEKIDAAKLVGEVILEMSDTVDIKPIIESVYGKGSELVDSWERLSSTIREVKSGSISKEDFYRSLIIVYNLEEEPDMEVEREVVYTAKFVVNKSHLLQKFPPKHEQIYGTHSTINFLPKNGIRDIKVGKETTMKIIGRVTDEYGDALIVENQESTNAYPHITLSCVAGVEPHYSNQMIQDAMESGNVIYFEGPYEDIDVVEGYFSGDNIAVVAE